MTSDRSVSRTERWGDEAVVAVSRPELRHAVSMALRAEGLSVWTTYDGRKASRRLSEALRRRSPITVDVVIADHALLGRSGFDLVAEARNLGSLVPFVIVASPEASAADVRFDPRVIVVRYPVRAEDICDAAALLTGWPPAPLDRVASAGLTHHVSDLGAAEERRARIRAAVELRVSLDSIEGVLQAQCTNLSAGGMFLTGAERHAKGELLVNRFELPGQDGRIRTLAEVVRCGADPSSSSGCGARFVRISPAHVHAIDDFVIGVRAAGRAAST